MNWEFEAIGTQWRITTKDSLISKSTKKQVEKRIELFDKTYSRFRVDSLVGRMRKKPGTYNLPQDALPLLKLYRALYEVSDGRVTPLIGLTMEQAGYDKNYSLKVRERTKIPGWTEAMEVGADVVTIKLPGVLLDFGAAGKGCLVDIVAALLRSTGTSDFVINAGGDIWVEGRPETVGLEDPFDASQAIGTVSVSCRAICGSSPARRSWGSFHHIIDPDTLLPEPNVQATWVIADSCMLADGLATALSFVSPRKLRKKFRFEYAMIESGNIHASRGFRANFFTA